jgi:tripartite-type tricarboxylate transporter receptor subunit TctC
MKKLLITLLASAGIMSAAQADYTLIVPQAPGKGTSVWAGIIAKNLSKFLDEASCDSSHPRCQRHSRLQQVP